MVKLTITNNRSLSNESNSGLELNELNINAKGGTELMQNALYQRIDKGLLDNFQIICSRVRDLKNDKIKILWAHDLAGDTEVQFLKDDGYSVFDKIVFVSHWQQQQYNTILGVPYSKGTVMLNAIDPIESHDKPDDVINLVYFSTPHRGLEILVPVFEHLHENNFKTLNKEVHLHVYSSFKLYGWEARDKPYLELFERCKNHPNIHYHGAVSNQQIHEDLKKMHILAYPCIWPETSCIVLMEAMSAGLICVHSSFAALPETASNWTLMYPMTENNSDHANVFAQNLYNAVRLQETGSLNERLRLQSMYANSFYNWDVRAMQWDNLLKELCNGPV